MTLLARAMEALRDMRKRFAACAMRNGSDEWAINGACESADAILAEYDRAQGESLYKEAIDCLRAVADERCGGHWQWAAAIIKALDTTQPQATHDRAQGEGDVEAREALEYLSAALGHPALEWNTDEGGTIERALVEYALQRIRQSEEPDTTQPQATHDRAHGDDWVLVPREPTDEQLAELDGNEEDPGISQRTRREWYRNFIAVAAQKTYTAQPKETPHE